MSPDRYVLSKNEPGSKWYRIPTAGICDDISEGRIEALESECAFFDSGPDSDYDGPNTVLVQVSLGRVNSTRAS